jgi:predicted anti-sigma-YlaC factor YlaD
MSEHTVIYELLPLAAAGTLDTVEQRQVQEHLVHCEECRTEFECWSRLIGALSELPKPLTPQGLLIRTHSLLEIQAATRKEFRWNQRMLVFLVIFSWTATLLNWLIVHFLDSRLTLWLNISSTRLTELWVLHLLLAWLATAWVAGMLGKRSQREGRIV